MTDAASRHQPVMLDRCVDLLAPALNHEGALVVDGTLGMGGHTEAILERCQLATVVGIDRDPQAIALASARLARFGDRFIAHHAEYDDIAGAVAAAGADLADGVLLDLGVSSLQIDEADRGFSYAQDAPLDMRMNPEDPVTAADLLRDADQRELARILRVYGEERFASRIAESIVKRRETAPLTRSAEPRRPGARVYPRRQQDARLEPRQADLPGSAHRGEPRGSRSSRTPCLPRSRAYGSADAWSWSRITRSRTSSSRQPSPRAPRRRRLLDCP
ncbi:hypothetical protein GCM10025876_33600 [Demequina litorisediminis]|uniref:Uncharacterized protein n=1 Tax=Demequina litorisediminis TaxID=1849022 RepID=A0ABQ6IJ77_9MICO|nr:hypothetical protein GCM10025876_33600 [Demequina litorisediminis]